MRHFRSILYALVLGPAVWVLAGVGLTHDLTTRGRDDFAVESITGLLLLVLGGAAYAILVFAPISPAGPLVAGLAFLGVSVWALETPSAYAGFWPGSVAKEGFDLSRPGYGLAALLAVPLICTALSARRWERYEPPVLPIIGRIGRARGAAAVAGTPIAAVETAPLPRRGPDPDATTLLPGRTTDPDPTTVLRLPAGSESTTTVIASGDDTTVIRSLTEPDESTAPLNGSDPTIAVNQPTTVPAGTAEEPAEPSTAEVEPSTAEVASPTAEVTSPTPDDEAATAEDEVPTSDNEVATAEDEAATVADEADEAPTEPVRTGESAAAGTGAGDEEPTAANEAAADEPPTAELDEPDTVAAPPAAEEAVRRPIPLPRAVPAEERTRDLSDRVDTERTQVIRLAVADQDEQTQVVRLPGETTRVIPFPGTGEDTQVIRLPARPDDQESTQVIRPTVEPPDRTEVVQFPARNGAKEDRQPSIADAEAPNIDDDPTSRLAPPGQRRDEDAAKRSMTVMKMERPPDDGE